MRTFSRALSAPACALALLASLTSLTSSATAQTAADLAARRQMLEQAQSARAAGDHARALDLAQRALRLHATSSVHRFVAEEQLALGQLADALGSADTCQREAAVEGARSQVHATACRRLAGDLRARVGSLLVRIPTPAPTGLRLTIAGNTVPEALWNIAYPVTPGVVLVEAAAPGFLPFRREITLARARDTATLDVTLAPAPVQNNVPAAPVDGTLRLVITGPDGGPAPDGLTLLLDGAPIAAAARTLEHLAPGEHLIEATAPGFRRTRVSATVTAGQFHAVPIELQRAEEATPPPDDAGTPGGYSLE